jgi:hypothetical protein
MGYEEIVVQDLKLSPQVTRYRREPWQTPQGETIIADIDPGIVGGMAPISIALCGASFLRASHLRTDRRPSQWHGCTDNPAPRRTDPPRSLLASRSSPGNLPRLL